MKGCCVILLLGSLLGAAAAAQPQLTVVPSLRSATVGERIELRVVVRGAGVGTAAILRLAPGDYQLLEEKTLAVPSQPASRGLIERQLTIAFFRTGEFSVGPLEVELHGPGGITEKLRAPPLAITIRSVLTPADTDIRPLKPLVPMAGDPLRLLPWLLLPLALLAAVWLSVWWRRRCRSVAATPLPPPEEELAAGLATLLARQLLPENRQLEFFVALSDLAKRFLERFYGYNADDLTSSETIAALLEREPQPPVVREFERLLQEADLVKFARQDAPPAAVSGIVDGCRSLVEEYRRRRRLAESAEHHDPAQP